MKKKISRYISLLLILNSMLLLPSYAWGQKKSKEELKADYKASPFYQGSSIGIEVAGLANHLIGGDILSSEIILQSNLKNRFFPTVEIGYGETDVIHDTNDMHYKTSAPFFRIGMDYNAFYLKPYLPGYLYAGLRYGMTSFTYDINGPTMNDPNYGGVIQIPYEFKGNKSNASWIEAVVGIKVKIYKGFCMVWAVRYKRRINVANAENSEPWYIPGFGKNASSSFNLTYNLIYNLPF